ncbi:Serum paraoxonase arylesterase family protein [Geosmithia morbida]|uniref:Serum paraoxonase arylesterase family protein n=1 Tax=Geosmithia morbida TaxID=1094350 RepID=A0A9P5D4K4_9HYPO|nr:Serum paraoxonase arylesterase family protein [Geosmithia morbida]KAF4122885.1 Serum paraoxonase arylesterase family protein [Geosmithia morbida]
MQTTRLFLGAGLVALLVAVYAPVIGHFITMIGVFRHPRQTHANASQVVVIDDTVHCEDLHHHVASNTLFTACEDSPDTRMSWFPGLAILDDPVKAMNSRGSIHTIDPKTFKSQRLKLENFDEPFITHGIEVISDNANSVYIYAVNHLPHPDYVAAYRFDRAMAKKMPTKARSQIEVFHHVLGSSSAKHVRSIVHPLIQTPNDIFALSPHSIYVTNDHYHREGLRRKVEDLYAGNKWSNTVHVHIDELSKVDPTLGLNASVAITGLHNNNGLGYSPVGMAIGCAASGQLHLARTDGKVVESLTFDSTIDNPSFFQGRNISGYVLGGLSRAVDLENTIHDPQGKEPVIVWFAHQTSNGWEKKVLFEDDGSRIRSSSAAVLVQDGTSSLWLFVTGFLSNNMVAVQVDLE